MLWRFIDAFSLSSLAFKTQLLLVGALPYQQEQNEAVKETSYLALRNPGFFHVARLASPVLGHVGAGEPARHIRRNYFLLGNS